MSIILLMLFHNLEIQYTLINEKDIYVDTKAALKIISTRKYKYSILKSYINIIIIEIMHNYLSMNGLITRI